MEKVSMYDVWEEFQRFARRIGVQYIGDFVTEPADINAEYDGRKFEIINRHNHRLLSTWRYDVSSGNFVKV